MNHEGNSNLVYCLIERHVAVFRKFQPHKRPVGTWLLHHRWHGLLWSCGNKRWVFRQGQSSNSENPDPAVPYLQLPFNKVESRLTCWTAGLNALRMYPVSCWSHKADGYKVKAYSRRWYYPMARRTQRRSQYHLFIYALEDLAWRLRLRFVSLILQSTRSEYTKIADPEIEIRRYWNPLKDVVSGRLVPPVWQRPRVVMESVDGYRTGRTRLGMPEWLKLALTWSNTGNGTALSWERFIPTSFLYRLCWRTRDSRFRHQYGRHMRFRSDDSRSSTNGWLLLSSIRPIRWWSFCFAGCGLPAEWWALWWLILIRFVLQSMEKRKEKAQRRNLDGRYARQVVQWSGLCLAAHGLSSIGNAVPAST